MATECIDGNLPSMHSFVTLTVYVLLPHSYRGTVNLQVFKEKLFHIKCVLSVIISINVQLWA